MYALKDGMSIQDLDNLIEAASAAKQAKLAESKRPKTIVQSGGAFWLKGFTIEKRNKKSLILNDGFGGRIRCAFSYLNDDNIAINKLTIEYK